MSTQTNEVTAITTLAQQITSDNLINWSDDRRKSFTNTFSSRVRAAQYILVKTAQYVAERASKKHFISGKHLTPAVVAQYKDTGITFYDTAPVDRYYNRTDKDLIGGRTRGELRQIAEDRADAIIDQLPRLADAVRILSPEVATMIVQRDKLVAKGKEIFEKANELAGALDLDSVDQDMSISSFRAAMKAREKKRADYLTQLDEIGEEARSLDSKINKFLYEGLPGLTEAVLTVIREHSERAKGFSGLNRRVAEQVQFGDSEAALEMLKAFEKDEVKISSEIQTQFNQALEALKIAGKKGIGTERTKKLMSSKKG